MTATDTSPADATDSDIESDDTSDSVDTVAGADSTAAGSSATRRRSGRTTAARADADVPSAARRYVRPALLLVVTIALAVAGALFLVRAHDLGSGRAVDNAAVVDAGRTSTVIGQVSTALNQVLSYDYRKPQVAKAAAAKWLTGDAPSQYAVLFKQLQTLAPGQKLTLVAKVSTAGVVSLVGDNAQLLVFIDQQSTRASDNQSSVSAAQVQIGAVFVDGRWKIKELNPI